MNMITTLFTAIGVAAVGLFVLMLMFEGFQKWEARQVLKQSRIEELKKLRQEHDLLSDRFFTLRQNYQEERNAIRIKLSREIEGMTEAHNTVAEILYKLGNEHNKLVKAVMGLADAATGITEVLANHIYSELEAEDMEDSEACINECDGCTGCDIEPMEEDLRRQVYNDSDEIV